MAFEVPPLPYDYNALEPHIDEQTMRVHHDKHHQAYVDNANKALEGTDLAGRGWAWTAYDWDEGRLFNYVGDAQNTFPIWNATPLIALDVYEHAYWLDYQTDRASYIDAFFDNLDWSTINDWVSKYQIKT